MWWLEQRDKAPLAMVEEVEDAIERLEKHGPRLGTAVRSKACPGLRRVPLPRVRQYVYFHLNAEGVIEVLCLWHTSKPGHPSI